MKVVWRAEMTMVWRPSYDLSQSLVQREEERRKETGHRRILARTVIAMEIQSYSPYYLLGNPQEAGYRCRKDITADLIRSALINCCWHLFSWDRVSVT